MKKIICLSLSLILMICSVFAVDLSAYAVNTENTEFENTEFNTLYINPMLKESKKEILEELSELDEQAEQETQSTSSSSSLRFASSYPTADQAADTLRDAMVNRENTINIKFLSGTISTTSAVENVFSSAIDQSNSVSSQDGDYLHWHIAGVAYRATSSVVNKKYLYDVTFSAEYLTTALQEERVTYKINEVNKELDLSGKSDYIKALEIHDAVCDFIKYDYDYVTDYEKTGIDNPLKHSAYAGLFSGLAVCQSYATLFYRLCYENGLNSRVVTSSDHAWNIVNVYGKNYFVDCTWDDGLYDNPADTSGNYWAAYYGYDYFLYGSEDYLDFSHVLESDYTKSSFTNAYPIEKNGLINDACPHEATENIAPADASCSTGFTGKTRCRVCLYPLGTYTVPQNSEHAYISEVTAPSCTAKGYTHHECEYCSYSYNDTYVAAFGHNYVNRISPATLTDSGKLTPVCTICKAAKSSTTLYAIKTISLSTTSYTYNGKAKTPSVTVKDSKGNKLVKGTDYTVTYASGRTKIGKYKVTVTFKGNYSGKKNLYFTISPKSVSLSTTTYTYNGKVKKPSVIIKDANGNKLSSSNYTVTYSSGRKNVGKYKVTIKLKNGHSGTYTKYFTIKPAKTSVTKLTAAKKAITVKWTKKTTQVTGYQIQYSTKSDFSSAKTVKVTKNSTTSKKLTGLSAKKKYYVRIRTYKTVNGTTYYSAWSAKKSIKTK